MKSTTFALGSLLAAIAIAQPHQQIQHQHAARHLKRGNAETIVMYTEYVTEVETVGVTTTIWVSPGFVAPADATTTSSSTSSAAVAIGSTGAQFLQPASSSSAQAQTTFATIASSSSSSAYVAPTTSSVYVAPVESTASAAPVEIQATSSTPAAAAYIPPATTTSAAPAATSSASSSTGGVCTDPSDPCTGDITYYTAGLGACGWDNDGDTENVVALPYELMGTESNDNPYCGKMITIMSGGKTTTAKVVDKCEGCNNYSIDLSTAAFQDLSELSVGRTTCSWYFN